MASGRVVALEPGSQTEEYRGVEDGDKQDRYEGGKQLRQGGSVLLAIR